MKKLIPFILSFLLTFSLKAQTQEELAKAQQEDYAQMFANMTNCDTLEKTLMLQFKALKNQGLAEAQMDEMKKAIDLQIKNCRSNQAMYGTVENGKFKPNYPTSNVKGETNEPNSLPSQKPPFKTLQIPSAYQITYQIKDGKDVINMDIFLSAENANYGVITKDPETGEDFYSIFKEATKKMYIVGKGTVMSYDFAKFQQSGQNLTPTKADMAKYKLKPTGVTETIAGYLCKVLAGKTDDGSTLKLWIAYGIKSGSLVMPGVRYKATEKKLYKQFYGSEEAGFFLKGVNISKDGTTTITAIAVKKNPAQKTIDISKYNYFDASTPFQNPNTK